MTIKYINFDIHIMSSQRLYTHRNKQIDYFLCMENKKMAVYFFLACEEIKIYQFIVFLCFLKGFTHIKLHNLIILHGQGFRAFIAIVKKKSKGINLMFTHPLKGYTQIKSYNFAILLFILLLILG